VYETSDSFLSKVAVKSDFRKKTLRCVIGFTDVTDEQQHQQLVGPDSDEEGGDECQMIVQSCSLQRP